MAILNYTTKIDTEKTALQIQKMLVKAKAQAVLYNYDDDGIMSDMSFRLMTKYGAVFFRLPANTDGVFNKLELGDDVPNRLKTKEQAARVAWRILKDWVEAQLAIVESEMADITEVFLPYAQDHTGRTVYESLKHDGFKSLTHQNK